MPREGAPKEVQDYLEKNVDPYFVPLLEKLVNEKPDDVASYCIAFFTEKQGGGGATAAPLEEKSAEGDSTSAAAAASSFDVAGMVTSAAAALEANPGNRCAKYLVQLSDEGKYAEMSAENLAKLYACAKTGLVNTDSGLGCYAMAPSDYEDFNFFFGE